MVQTRFFTFAFFILGSGLLLNSLAQTGFSQEPENTVLFLSKAKETPASYKITVTSQEKETSEGSSQRTASTTSNDKAAVKTAAAKKEKPEYPPFATVLKNATKIEGLITLHKKEDHVFAELKATDMNKDFFVLMTIARGIAYNHIYGGISWSTGDDWILQFRRAGKRIHLVRRNLRFRAKENSPTARAVKLAYSDSVLFSLPIVTRGAGGTYVVDLSSVFMSDLPQISQTLPGFVFSRNKSTWHQVKGYDKNIEIQIAATYASSGTSNIESVADTRGATINIHYSISSLPKTKYQPRLADDRIGYFGTVIKDFSEKDPKDRFVRYINRWNLQKSDPKAAISPPQKPIVFWLDKTIPYKYRKPIRDGILEWNKAFEKAGFYDAINVRQQPDNATWEPGDVRYNTFQWITSSAGFAMGPSRVNPSTGEILDADIIFDADFLKYWKREYETFTPRGIELLTGGPLEIKAYQQQQKNRPPFFKHQHSRHCACNLLNGMSHQLALGATVMAVRTQNPADLEKLIMQAMKDVAMHETGHTLGLRHNFKASTQHSIKELADIKLTRKNGLSASVMDYTPINLAPPSMKQGDYYTTTIGPYDYWAIEYGYKPFGKTTLGEKEDLAKIATRSGEKSLAYSTDEDTRGIDPDPHSNRFDNTNNVVEWAAQEAQLVREVMADILKNTTQEGEDYTKTRQTFGLLLSTHGRAMNFTARYIGGSYVSRSHKGDKNAPAPYVVVPATRQRAALELLKKEMFSDKPFSFPPKLYNHLAASHWNHWGVKFSERTDYPVHSVILTWQNRILERLLSSLTLTRLHDSELKVPAKEDAFTTAELIQGLTNSIFSELGTFPNTPFTTRKPAISSLRRNLQRSYLARISTIALGKTGAPADCTAVAKMQLLDLKSKITNDLKNVPKLDTYTRAHLLEIQAKITQVEKAGLFLNN